MTSPLLILIVSQLLFSTSDLLARHYMPTLGFKLTTFLSGWFAIYFGIRLFGTLGQLYVFTTVELGRTMTLFGISSIVVANVLGLLVLKEQLSVMVYIGIVVAIIAFLIVGFGK